MVKEVFRVEITSPSNSTAKGLSDLTMSWYDRQERVKGSPENFLCDSFKSVRIALGSDIFSQSWT